MTSKVVFRRCALGGAILLAGCLLLTACAGGGGSSGSSAAQVGKAAPPAPNGSTGYGAAGSSGGNAAWFTAGLAPAHQSIIYTATITLRAANVAATARRITSIVQTAGGYVSAENAGTPGTSGAGNTRQTISITLKVPVPAYPTVFAQLSSPALGKQLEMKQDASDVTQKVANVNSLVTSQQDAINALEGLLKRAGSVADLLRVQQQISDDETTLNSLLAQQRALNGETSYATITMTLLSPPHVA
ncbi:MAG: DUF4349 domain-containing protein, partial [Actinobacteria bacterium]|nr:DUF4349 domain-containing protein [Actinomycetota bacterium]